jgi:hypothetical protein
VRKEGCGRKESKKNRKMTTAKYTSGKNSSRKTKQAEKQIEKNEPEIRALRKTAKRKNVKNGRNGKLARKQIVTFWLGLGLVRVRVRLSYG